MASGSPALVSLPAASLFSFPPNSEPVTLSPPPPGSSTFAPPFEIPERIYQAAYDPRVPITIALVYAVTVKALNAYNRSTNKKPWAISKTRIFSAFVVLHNVFLAVYSAWTWWGMLGALRRSMVNPLGPEGLAGFADSACRLHGPAGLTKAVFFTEEQRWQTLSQDVMLAADGTPSRTDMGRIWNEGLAFYGWIFYLSKFYEVLDTFIILAKGKLSSTLQTYHHAGAMMCMWAGMRYMSPPIWMFAFVNSGIHALMYTYYTLSAFSIRVPMIVKRTLTSMQITQFLIGASYAMMHSFVSYTVPVVVTISQRTARAASAPSIAAAEPTPAALLDSFKKFVQGAASRVSSASSTAPSVSLGSAVEDLTQTTTYSQRVVPCITTTGQTFAIWLNVLYLAPLTYLFVKFFITSYLRRSSAETARVKKIKDTGAGDRRLSNVVQTAEKAGWDAAKGVEREVYGDGEEAVVEESDAEKEQLLSVNGNGKAKSKANGRTLRPRP